MMQRTFGEQTIEELPRSFMCGYTELRSGSFVLARHGPSGEVGFSMCLPIIAPPQIRGRELLIDGSLINNLPVEAMADMGEGPVIAVDVKASFERPAGGEGHTATAGPSRTERPARGAVRAAPEPRRDADPRAAAGQRQHLRGGPPARGPDHQTPRGRRGPARVPPARRSARGGTGGGPEALEQAPALLFG